MPAKNSSENARQRRQINDVEYVGSAEAMSILGVRRETLYTYVSRGLIKTKQRPGVKAKLYRKADVETLRSRAVARAGGPQVSQSLRYGDAVVRLRACERTAPWEPDQLTGAFVQASAICKRRDRLIQSVPPSDRSA